MPTIKVRARGTALVSDFKQLFNGRKVFVGWQHDPSIGDEVEILDETGARKKVRQSGWRKLDADTELDVSDPEIALEYRRALAVGDLYAADDATVAFANHGGFAEKVGGAAIKFDPSFGVPSKPKKEG